MFEQYTYEKIMEEILNSAPGDIDKRQGSIFFDAVSGAAIKIAEQYTNLEYLFELSQLSTAPGEYLDAIADQYGITRHSATKAVYRAVLDGTLPENGERFFHEGLYFVFRNDRDLGYVFEAEEAGTAYNEILPESPATPVDTVLGLTAASFGTILSYASPIEDDETLRLRIREKISGAGENGNKQHYINWCESVNGVAKARVFPLWNGANTVKAVLISANGKPCQPSVVSEVQEYVDPAELGSTAEIDGHTYVVGDGLGEGAASIGAHFTAAAAFPLSVDISLDVTLKDGASVSDVSEKIEDILSEHFRELALNGNDRVPQTVRYNTVAALITTGVSEIEDFTDLTINGGASNIEVGTAYVPVLGEVNVNEIS